MKTEKKEMVIKGSCCVMKSGHPQLGPQDANGLITGALTPLGPTS